MDQHVNEQTVSPNEPRSSRRRWVCLTICSVVLGFTVLFVGVIGKWVHYRHGHIVAGDATVKSIITQVGARLNGVVTSLEVKVSQEVKKGDLLARLDDRPFRATVDQWQSRLETAVQELKVERLAIEQERDVLTVRVKRAHADLETSVAQVEAAESDRSLWQYEFTWRTERERMGAVSYKEWFDARAGLGVASGMATAAHARRKAAEISLREADIELVGLTVREANLKVLEARVAAARAALALAKADLEATYILAPEDGWVADWITGPGGSVRIGDQIVALRLKNPTWVDAWVDETDLVDIEIGQTASVKINAYSDSVITGRVVAIGALADTELRGNAFPDTPSVLRQRGAKINIRIALDNVDGVLIPGLSVVVGIARKDSPTPFSLTRLRDDTMDSLYAWSSSWPLLRESSLVYAETSRDSDGSE